MQWRLRAEVGPAAEQRLSPLPSLGLYLVYHQLYCVHRSTDNISRCEPSYEIFHQRVEDEA